MIKQAIPQEVLKYLQKLPPDKQQEILDLARKMAEPPKGTPGNTLLRFGGCIDKEDIKLMQKAINQGCERIDTDEW
ncbi:MAG TPA: hypothetical protein ACFYD5_05415 [Candidatus Tripitaka sp. YC43]